MGQVRHLAADSKALEDGISALQQKLSKKASFEAALQECQALVCSAARSGTLGNATEALMSFFQRARTLLRSRYTNVAFWAALEKLADTTQMVTRDKQLIQLLCEIKPECVERKGDTPAAPSSATFFFEGQLSNEAPQTNGLPAASTEGFQQELQSAAGRVAEAVAAARQQNGNAQALDEDLEAQAIIDILQASDPPPPPRKPPQAGRRAMRQLKVIASVKPEDLEQLGGAGSACSICREAFVLGDTAQIMPCSDAHVFHPLCLKPWMDENNSCPICRHELETDDADYEYRKTVDKQRAEDNQGAANAQSHNEFIYL